MPTAKYALLLHGRLGTVTRPPAASLRVSWCGPAVAYDQCFSGSGYVSLLAASHLEHIVTASAAVSVDVFVHSWNPELASRLDAAYAPHLRGSLHEAVNASLPKAASQALSIGRCTRLARAAELARGREYRVVLVMRLDAVPLEPLRLRTLSPSHVTLAESCCLSEANELDAAAFPRACGHELDLSQGWRGVRWASQKRVVSHCRAQLPRRRHMHKQIELFELLEGTEANEAGNDLRYFVRDWWFAAKSEIALTFEAIGARFGWYEAQSFALGLRFTGDRLWSHTAWPLHIHDAIHRGAQLRFLAWHVALGRNVYRPLLFHSAGKLEVGTGGGGKASMGKGSACDSQDFDPGVLLASPALDAQLRRAGALLRPELAEVFSGRFRPMANMCPAASYLPTRSVVCCGNSTLNRRWCGPQRRHQRACVRAWRSLQPRLRTLNQTALLSDLAPQGRRWVAYWNGRHKPDRGETRDANYLEPEPALTSNSTSAVFIEASSLRRRD